MGGALGAPESAGLSLGLSAVGVTSVVVGGAEVARGATNIATGLGVVQDAISRGFQSRGGGGKARTETFVRDGIGYKLTGNFDKLEATEPGAQVYIVRNARGEQMSLCL